MVYSEVKKELIDNPSEELVKEVLDEILNVYGECFVDLGIVGEDALADWVDENPNLNESEISDLYSDFNVVAKYLMETDFDSLMDVLDELIEDFE